MSNVDHPSHYGGADNPYEVIKVLQAWMTPEEYVGFCKGNALKYLARHRQKGGDEDLHKATWYQRELDRFIAENPTVVNPKTGKIRNREDGKVLKPDCW